MIGKLFAGYPGIIKETSVALAPILAIFVVYHLFFKRTKMAYFFRALLGVAISFIGLTLFLQGVEVGYIPVGSELGKKLAGLPYRWILIPIGFVLGFTVTTAEPSLHVLVGEIEKVTNGALPKKVMFLTLCLGVAVSIALAMIRILVGFSLWYLLVPGYALAIILSFIVPPVFTSIAFDSGGVATGTMTATFLLSLALGASRQMAEESGGAFTEGFGLIALVALMPIITVLGLGLIYLQQERRQERREADQQKRYKEDESHESNQ